MKRNVFGILTTLTLSLLVSVLTHAQTIARATVPFDFTVGQTQMRAGTYVISPLTQAAIMIRDGKTSEGVYTLFRSEQAGRGDSNPKLVFHRYGDKYFLSQVSPGYGSAVMQLPTSKLEKELRIATTRGVPVQEVIAAMK
jgi:hypothetical protein